VPWLHAAAVRLRIYPRTHAAGQHISIIPSGRPTGMAADAGHSDSGRTGVGCAGTAFTSTRANFAIGWATALSVPSSRCQRHVQSNPPLMPYRRACDGRYTAISRFCSTGHRRSLSPRVITSTRGPRTLIRSVVRAPLPQLSSRPLMRRPSPWTTRITPGTPSRNVGSTLG